MICPVCGHRFTHHSAIVRALDPIAEEPRPAAGAWSVCLGCGAPLIFVSPTELRALRGDELVTADPERVILVGKLRSYIRQYRARDN